MSKPGKIFAAYVAIMAFLFGFVCLTVGLGVIPLVAALTGVAMPFWPTILTLWLTTWLLANKSAAVKEVTK